MTDEPMTDGALKETPTEVPEQEKRERPPPARQGRIIVRNLVFDMREKHLKKAFAKFGKIDSIDVPLNNTNNQNRGFAFIEFSGKGEAQAAITAMNGSTFKGRPLTVEFSLPKASYETKVQHVLDNTNQTKQDVIKPKSVKLEEKKKEVEEEVKPEQKVKAKPERQKDSADSTTDATLFVRNIAWDVTQQDFKEHMEQFGQVTYAVLCKAAGDMKVEQLEDALPTTHKGTGFVRFKKPEDATSLLQLSQQLEKQLDQEHIDKNKKNAKQGKKATDSIIGQASLLKGELELNGRRLVILPSVARTKVSDVLQQNKDMSKGTGEDRRNLYLKKEGLLSEKDWIHQQPQLTSKDLEQRQALYIAKDSALKKSPNLSVSRVRLQIRNLPKREFYEPELRALMITVMDAYRAANPDVKLTSKRLITQTKVLRDAEKQVQVAEPSDQSGSLGTAFKLASGLAFVELVNHEAALFTVRYLNNMQLTNRGLIVDFCLQDARKMFRRTQKLEKHQRLAMERKQDARKERRAKSRAEDDKVQNTVELGTGVIQQKKKKATIDDINDVDALTKLKTDSLSRGKKQRINKKIAALTGQTEEVKKVPKTVKHDAKQKVDKILKKREEKMAEKSAQKKPIYTAEDKELIKQQKNSKRDKRRENAKTVEDFDAIYKDYEKKLLKRLDKGEDKSKPAFEEIEFSD